jgi:hypothetical protein
MTETNLPDLCTHEKPITADGPVPFRPEWKTETVLALLKGIQDEAAFDRMAILADALEEAGCDDQELLRHCRECNRHEATCWAMNYIVNDGIIAQAEPQFNIISLNDLDALEQALAERRRAIESARRALEREQRDGKPNMSWVVWATVVISLIIIRFGVAIVSRFDRSADESRPAHYQAPPVYVPTIYAEENSSPLIFSKDGTISVADHYRQVNTKAKKDKK